MTSYRAAFSDGHVLVSATAEKRCSARSEGAVPTHAWRGCAPRSNGSTYQDGGFAISRRSAEIAILQFRRTIKPRKPSFTEIVEAEAVP